MNTIQVKAALFACILSLSLYACGSGDESTASPDTSTADVMEDTSQSGDALSDLVAIEDAPPPQDMATEDLVSVQDSAAPPVEPAALPIYSAGTCPELSAGNQGFTSGSSQRTVHVTLPDEPQGAPVVFLFHGLGDQAQNIAYFLGAAQAASGQGAIVVALQGGVNQFGWDFGSPSPMPGDLVFFDDVLSCLDVQFEIDTSRIYASGFSAGALWTSYLILNRSQYLAAAVTFSGGTGSVTGLGYKAPEYPTPAVISWGGTADVYGGFLNFESTSKALSDGLQADGHFVVECNHGLGHTVPMDAVNWLYPFLFSHSFGVSESPYAGGLDGTFPAYCQIP